jgi:hypothetical protein
MRCPALLLLLPLVSVGPACSATTKHPVGCFLLLLFLQLSSATAVMLAATYTHL